MTLDRYWDPRIQTISREELGDVQAHRLHWQVRRCWDGSEFYRERFEAAGVRPEDIGGLDDLERLPILTRMEVEEDRSAHPPFGRAVVARADWLITPKTPSTLCTEADAVNRVSVAARALWAFGARPVSVLAVAQLGEQTSALETIQAAVRKLGATPRLERESPSGQQTEEVLVRPIGEHPAWITVWGHAPRRSWRTP